jgi:hypothetical protein
MSLHRDDISAGGTPKKAQMENTVMTRRIWLVGLILAALILPSSPMRGQQSRSTPQTGRTTKSALRKIYDEDQKDRTDEAGDARRREQVQRLIGDGKVKSGEDYYYAAFIFQHGQKPNDFLFAHVLAVTAVSKGFHGAIWLSAATLDRYLHSMKQPQIFGTQFGSLNDGSDDQGLYDEEMLPDGLRAMWCVASHSAQTKILSDVRAGKDFRSTRICPLP